MLYVFKEINQKIVRKQGEPFGIEENKFYKIIAQKKVIIKKIINFKIESVITNK